MSSSASTFIGGLSIGAVGALVVQQLASTPAPEPVQVPDTIMSVVSLVLLGLTVVVIWAGMAYMPRGV